QRRATRSHRQRDRRGHVRVHGAKNGPVLEMQGEPHRVPRVPAGDRLAEKLDVVIAAIEQPLVERLLEGPDSCGESTTDGSSQRARAVDAWAQDSQTVTGGT